MFKKTIIASTILASLAFNVAQAADGTINFTGSITDQTCDISSAAKDLDVALGAISDDAFSGTGDIAGTQQFTIDMNTCPAGVSSVSARFDGTPVGGDNSIIALEAGATATGVGVQLRETDGTVLPLSTNSKPVAVTSGSAKMDFTASYIATAPTVGAGTANASATYTVIYN